MKYVKDNPRLNDEENYDAVPYFIVRVVGGIIIILIVFVLISLFK